MTILGLETTLTGEDESKWFLVQEHYGEEVWDVMQKFIRDKIREEYNKILEEYESSQEEYLAWFEEYKRGGKNGLHRVNELR